MFTIHCYHEKDGSNTITMWEGQPVTEKNLDSVLTELETNFGFEVTDILKDDTSLTAAEISEIRQEFPLNHEELFKQRLKENGLIKVSGKTIEYKWADGDNRRSLLEGDLEEIQEAIEEGETKGVIDQFDVEKGDYVSCEWNVLVNQ